MPVLRCRQPMSLVAASCNSASGQSGPHGAQSQTAAFQGIPEIQRLSRFRPYVNPSLSVSLGSLSRNTKRPSANRIKNVWRRQNVN